MEGLWEALTSLFEKLLAWARELVASVRQRLISNRTGPPGVPLVRSLRVAPVEQQPRPEAGFEQATGAEVPERAAVEEERWRLLRVRRRADVSFDVRLPKEAPAFRAGLASYRLRVAQGVLEFQGELLVEAKGNGEPESYNLPCSHQHHLPGASEDWQWMCPQVQLAAPEEGRSVARVSMEGYALEPALVPVRRHGATLVVQGECPVARLRAEVVLYGALPADADRVVKTEVTPYQVTFQATDGRIIAEGAVKKTVFYAAGNVVKETTEDLVFTELLPAGTVRKGDAVEALELSHLVVDTREHGQGRQQIRLAFDLAIYRREFREVAAGLRPGPGLVPVLAEVQVGELVNADCTWTEHADVPGQVMDLDLEVRSTEARAETGRVAFAGSAFQEVLYVGSDGLIHLADRRTRFQGAAPCAVATEGMAAHLHDVRVTGVRLAGSRHVRWQVLVECTVRLTSRRIIYVPG
ncbi:MAG: DUF3794 domain-containing protein [Bacillota bacterium]